MSLTIILVTRGRPHLLGPTIEETMRNAARADTRMVVAVDADDVQTRSAIHSGTFDKRVICSIREREDSVGAKYNARIPLAPAAVYVGLVDYTPCQSFGFDQVILDAAMVFPDGIGCVFSDLINLSFTGMHSATARMVELMGGFYPEHFPYWFVDHWLDDLAKMTGRFTHVDIAMDHFTRRPGTMEKREPWLWASLYDAMWPERHSQADRILAACDMTDAQRSMLRAQWPLVDQRSRILNNMVRGMTEPGLPHDERYLRLRAKAVARLQIFADENRVAA